METNKKRNDSNGQLTKLKGKIIRDNDCPLKKKILCENCENYDGWGFDIKSFEFDVYCNHPNIIDFGKVNLYNITNKKKPKKRKTLIEIIKWLLKTTLNLK